jgi:hypothetical protein
MAFWVRRRRDSCRAEMKDKMKSVSARAIWCLWLTSEIILCGVLVRLESTKQDIILRYQMIFMPLFSAESGNQLTICSA